MKKLSKLYEGLLRETSNISGKDLLVVDIQPEYQNGFSYWLDDFIIFINENYKSLNRLVFYYNGSETVGGVTEDEYKFWWHENGLEEDIIYRAKFYDKGYAFFRNCMDNGGDDESLVNLVKEMIRLGVNDSRDLDSEFWDQFVQDYGDEDIREIMEMSEDAINIPELMDDLKYYNNIVICGGGEYECLKEVHLALDVLDKPYQTLRRFVY